MNGIDKLKELAKDKAFVEGLLKNQTPEDAKAFLAEHGVDLSLDEVKAFGRQLGAVVKGEGELSESELADIAGGNDLGDTLNSIANDYDKGEFEFGKEFDKLWNWVTSW